MNRRNMLLHLALGMLAASGLCRADTPPDAFGYYATSNTTFSFVNVAGTGMRVMSNADDDAATVNIGFPFRFYGTIYTSVCMEICSAWRAPRFFFRFYRFCRNRSFLSISSRIFLR